MCHHGWGRDRCVCCGSCDPVPRMCALGVNRACIPCLSAMTPGCRGGFHTCGHAESSAWTCVYQCVCAPTRSVLNVRLADVPTRRLARTRTQEPEDAVLPSEEAPTASGRCKIVYENMPLPSSKPVRMKFGGVHASSGEVPQDAGAGKASKRAATVKEGREEPTVSAADMANRLMRQPQPLASLDSGKRKKVKVK
eukprot:353152-Chlamydomonas_euryale.AAC.7